MIVNILLAWYYFPDGDFTDFEAYFKTIYTKVYCRAGPYALGMWVAYLHLRHKEHDFAKGCSKVFMEWLCFVGYYISSAIGCFPWEKDIELQSFKVILSRPLFGCWISYLVLMMLSPGVADYPWYRLIRWIRWFFSLKLWMPFAYLSYAVYLVHIWVVWSATEGSRDLW